MLRAVFQAVEQIVQHAATATAATHPPLYSQLNKRNTYRMHRHTILCVQNLLHSHYAPSGVRVCVCVQCWDNSDGDRHKEILHVSVYVCKCVSV